MGNKWLCLDVKWWGLIFLVCSEITEFTLMVIGLVDANSSDCGGIQKSVAGCAIFGQWIVSNLFQLTHHLIENIEATGERELLEGAWAVTLFDVLSSAMGILSVVDITGCWDAGMIFLNIGECPRAHVWLSGRTLSLRIG
jgi:hypothetical protein